jgi:hypothetical protein
MPLVPQLRVVSCLAEMVPEVSMVVDIEYEVTTPVVASEVDEDEQPARIDEIKIRGTTIKLMDICFRFIPDSLTFV